MIDTEVSRTFDRRSALFLTGGAVLTSVLVIRMLQMQLFSYKDYKRNIYIDYVRYRFSVYDLDEVEFEDFSDVPVGAYNIEMIQSLAHADTYEINEEIERNEIYVERFIEYLKAYQIYKKLTNKNQDKLREIIEMEKDINEFYEEDNRVKE